MRRRITTEKCHLQTHHGHLRIICCRYFHLRYLVYVDGQRSTGNADKFYCTRPSFTIKLSAGLRINFEMLCLETMRDDVGEIMSRMSITSRISFINFLSSAGIRGCCTMYRYAAPASSRLHGSGLSFTFLVRCHYRVIKCLGMWCACSIVLYSGTNLYHRTLYRLSAHGSLFRNILSVM